MNMVVLAVVGVVLSRTLFRGQHVAFIMELPLYHVPSLRTIRFFVWNNTWAFVRKATTVILVFSVVIWALSTFPEDDIEQSYLARFGRRLAPLGQFLGMDWRMITALSSSVIAKENVIATLGILYGATPEEMSLAKAMAPHVSRATAMSFLTVMMLFIPCVPTLAVMRQETRSWGWTLFGAALLFVIALGAGALVYHGATWLGMGRPETLRNDASALGPLTSNAPLCVEYG
jgi:ferrous iron transport protein B